MSLLARSPVLDVPHGFSSRAGGVSEGPLATLNLSVRAGDSPERVSENWDRVVRSLGCGSTVDDLALLDQVHGAVVVEVGRGGGLSPVASADAAFTTTAGVVLGVRVADCVPVLLAGPGVVGVAHAGWRGTAGGVVAALIRAMGVAPEGLSAAIGPCISGGAYEVGDEVVEGLRGAGLPDAAFLIVGGPTPRAHVDLRRAVDFQLEAAGVTRRWTDPRCTATDPALYSHRRDGPLTGRFAGVIARAR